MPIEMPKGLPFSVDTWAPPPDRRKRHHFLTHAHKDHLARLPSHVRSHAASPIYASSLTIRLLLAFFPQFDRSLFTAIEAGESVLIDDPDGAFTVTAFDANHCPGSLMFLFEGEFGNILHTGDCRLTPECLQTLPLKYNAKKGDGMVCRLDYLFLDCTFARCPLKFPSTQLAAQQVISCIWKHPHAPVVYLSGDLLGQEEILIEVSKAFGSMIFVDKTEDSDCFQALSLVAPDIVSEDISSRFQVVGFSRLHEKASQKFAEARDTLQAKPIFIRPSAQWYATFDSCNKSQKHKPTLAEAIKDEFEIWHVCYSMHSSRDELEWALQFIEPKWVISTTPPCRAMELNYVKNHCYKTHIGPDDPFWKLFKGSTVKSTPLTFSDSETFESSVSNIVNGVSSSVDLDLLPGISSADQPNLKLDLPMPSELQPLTLFGRARFGLQDAGICKARVTDKEVLVFKQDTRIEQVSFVLGDKLTSTVKASYSQEHTLSERVSSLEPTEIAEAVSENINEYDDKKDNLVTTYSKDISISGPSTVDFIEEADDKSHISSILATSSSFNVSEPNIEKVEELSKIRQEMPTIGSSRNLNPSLRRLYRSMNVPIPRPLPSLTELVASCKRSRSDSESNNTMTLDKCYSSPASFPS